MNLCDAWDWALMKQKKTILMNTVSLAQPVLTGYYSSLFMLLTKLEKLQIHSVHGGFSSLPLYFQNRVHRINLATCKDHEAAIHVRF
jgi:hypothetical protein